MLTTCNKRDGQTFVGGAHRSICFGQTLCASESHKSIAGSAGPEIVDVILQHKQTVYGWGRASQAAGHASLDTGLHSPHTAASLVYSSALCLPGIKETEQDAAVSGRSCYADRCIYVTVFHLASCLSRTGSYALLPWTVGCVAY